VSGSDNWGLVDGMGFENQENKEDIENAGSKDRERS